MSGAKDREQRGGLRGGARKRSLLYPAESGLRKMPAACAIGVRLKGVTFSMMICVAKTRCAVVSKGYAKSFPP